MLSQRGRTLAEVLDGRTPNNFDFIRLVAAMLVMLSHGFMLTIEWPEGDLYFKYFEPMRAITGHDTLGGFAVRVFFIISGILVARSYLSDPKTLNYARKRALRIIPGLLACVLLCMLLLGPAVTTLSLSEYFTSPETGTFLINASLLPKLQFDLPGVFDFNHQYSVNGSLWSLPLECMMYVGVLGLGQLGLLRRSFVLPFVAAALLCHFTLSKHLNLTGLPMGGWLQAWMPKTIEFAYFFFAGTAMLLYKDRVVLDRRIFLSCLAAFVLTLPLLTGLSARLNAVIYFLTLPYLIVYLSFVPMPLARKLTSRGDFSYGTYLYGWPVQQTILHLLGNMSPVTLFLLAAPATLACAALSWHLVEKPFLKLKRQAAPITPATPAAAPALAAA